VGAAILIVTARCDYTSDLIVAELNSRDVPVLRLDPSDEEPVSLTAHLAPDGWDGTISQGGRSAALAEIRSVMWRWAWAPPGHQAISDPEHRTWAAKEDQAGIMGVLKTLPARWVNHPDRAAALSKAAQLVAAQTAGFATPPTLITNNGDAAAAWAAASPPGDLLYKAFFCQGVQDGGMVPASRIDPARLPCGDLYAASTFQQVITGQPIRVTVVGDRIFAAVIEGQDGRLDWRPGQQDAALHPVPVPPDTQARLRCFMAGSGLSYGGFDFITDHDGQWWFLEVNPSGQYGFVEIKAGLPITAAIADLLSHTPAPAPAAAREVAQ
jgi:hypothetical protein